MCILGASLFVGVVSLCLLGNIDAYTCTHLYLFCLLLQAAMRVLLLLCSLLTLVLALLLNACAIAECLR
jgi:hypothetical protein